MGNIIVKVHPWLMDIAVKNNYKCIVEVKPRIRRWQSISEDPVAIFQIDKFAVQNIVITFNVGEIIILNLLNIFISRCPLRKVNI